MSSTIIDYIFTLSEEEMLEAIAALSPEQRRDLAHQLCHTVNELAAELITHKKEIWDTGDLP